jgi:anti-sigma factor RsiW
MNCKEFVDFLMAYINEELPEEQRRGFEQHIQDCPPCINYLDTYRETVELERHAYEGEESAVSRKFPEQLIQAILAARKKTS